MWILLFYFGQTAEKINNSVLRELKKENRTLPIFRCSNLEEAVKEAQKQARPR